MLFSNNVPPNGRSSWLSLQDTDSWFRALEAQNSSKFGPQPHNVTAATALNLKTHKLEYDMKWTRTHW